MSEISVNNASLGSFSIYDILTVMIDLINSNVVLATDCPYKRLDIEVSVQSHNWDNSRRKLLTNFINRP